MAILKHEVSTEERLAYFKMRRAITGEDNGIENSEDSTLVLSQERYVELGALEEWILTITSQGFGKRSSAHEYRRSGRGVKELHLLILKDDKMASSHLLLLKMMIK